MELEINKFGQLVKVIDPDEVVIVPDSVNEIAVSAFRNCKSVKKVVIPATVKQINAAFSGCESLETVELAEGVEHMYFCSFKDSPKLKSITLPNSLTSNIEDLFVNCVSLESIRIPGGVKTIGSIIGEKYGKSGLSGCTNLREIKLEEGIEIIYGGSFQELTSLKEITFPSTIKSVESKAFSGCTKLGKIVIKGDVSAIAPQAFQKCPSLKEVYIQENQVEAAYKIFGKKVKLFTLDGQPLDAPKEEVKPKPAPSVFKDEDKDVIASIEKIIKIPKLIDWALKKELYNIKDLRSVKYAASGKKAPIEVILFILYEYMKQLPKKPTYHADSYKRDIVPLTISESADAVASLLDRETLIKALSKVYPSLHVEITWDVTDVIEVKIPLGGSFKKTMQKLEDQYIAVYHTIIKSVNPERVIPFCRYADDEAIEMIISAMENLMSNWQQPGKQAAIVFRSALLLSDTHAAAAYLKKNGLPLRNA